MSLDVEILQLYLDLFGDGLSFSEKQRIIDRIIVLTDKPSDRMHYRGTRGVLYLTIGDRARAEAEFREAVCEFRAESSSEELSGYERYRLALTLDALGTLSGEEKIFAEAIELLNGLLLEQHLEEKSKACFLAQLGETYKHIGAWDRAAALFRQSIELEPSAIRRVFLLRLFCTSMNSTRQPQFCPTFRMTRCPLRSRSITRLCLHRLLSKPGRRRSLNMPRMSSSTRMYQTLIFANVETPIS